MDCVDTYVIKALPLRCLGSLGFETEMVLPKPQHCLWIGILNAQIEHHGWLFSRVTHLVLLQCHEARIWTIFTRMV